MFFTGRQYQRNKPLRGRHRGVFSSLSYFSSRLVQHTKKFFIYRKISYWLTNHTQQECGKSKKKFSNCYSEYKAQPGYEGILQYWITDYEGIKDNNERVAQYFRDLSIDIQNDNIPEPESFYIKLEQFHTSFR